MRQRETADFDGPTLIVTKLKDGTFAWTVVKIRGVRFDPPARLGEPPVLTVSGWVQTEDWISGIPPEDWETEAEAIRRAVRAGTDGELR